MRVAQLLSGFLLRLALCCALILLTTVESRAQNVVTEWNTIAASTLRADGLRKPPPASGVWFAYTSIAVYDAVNAIHRRFQPFYYGGVAPAGASDEAAAAAAAHRVLVKYFPEQRMSLDAQLDRSLEEIAAAPDAKRAGISVGTAAADALINARAGDGLEANVTYLPGSGRGAWKPTPPELLRPLTPWLGQMRPFTMTSAAQFLPGGPTPLTSKQWTEDLNEVRILGGASSAVRTPQQTEIGLFWTENPSQQYARAFGYLVENYKLDTMDSARLMAMLWTGYADAIIGCFNAKYRYGFWRPVTAIQAEVGRQVLTTDLSWTSLATTPNFPEYPSGHASITGAVADLLERYFGTPKVHVVVDNHTFSDGIHTHTFENTGDLFDEVFLARIYVGYHYRLSLQDGGTMGRLIGEQLYRNFFRPVSK